MPSANPMPRPLNITMLGAGSFFTYSILKDVLLIPSSKGGELRLVDIDEKRLALAERLLQKVVERADAPWKVIASTDRRKLLKGTDYVVNSIEVSGLECVRFDNDIPLEFGVSQNIGDTIGPGGLFKALRTVPVYLEILKDAEELCPNALVLNYTNPMNIMCLAAQRTSSMETVGLCHSVQGTSKMLAEYAGVPYDQVQWKCAGINHLAWFTEFNGPPLPSQGEGLGVRVPDSPLPSQGEGLGVRVSSASLYPNLMAQAADRESAFSKAEPVRTDMMLHFGAFITESSGHLSEYLPYYRKRPDLLQKHTDTGYRGEESFYANNWPTWRQGQDVKREKLISGEDEIDWERSHEYGGYIIEAIEKNQPTVIHGNVANEGCISNLSADGCVEVACLVNHNRIQPIKFGALPKQMAAICDSNMRMFDIAADACIRRDKELAIQALILDPLTSAVCSPAEIRAMALKMFEAEAQYLPGF